VFQEVAFGNIVSESVGGGGVLNSPDERFSQTERLCLSVVALASVCTYSAPTLLFAFVLKRCLSFAFLLPLTFILLLSLCPSFFFSIFTFLLSRSFDSFSLSFSVHPVRSFLNVINVFFIVPILYIPLSLSFLIYFVISNSKR
jgi:hypothetical protein